MRQALFFPAALIAIVFCGESSYAQRKVLAFADALKIGIQNNVLLNTQRNTWEYNQVQRVQSITAVAPNISLFAQAVQTNGNSFNQNLGQVVNGVRDYVSGSVNANLNLFSGFNRINQIKQYANMLDAQSYFVARTRQDAINTIATQYLAVMLDVELLKIARENFAALDKQLLQIREQTNLGARSPVDVYNQDALTKAADLTRIQAEIKLDNDRTTLTQTLLIDPNEEYDVEKPVWDLNALSLDSMDVNALAEKAKLNRGDYLRAVKQEAGYRFGTAAQRSNMLPSITAVGGYGSAYNNQHGATNLPFDEQFRTNNLQKQYGLQLNVPIFQGLQTRTLMAQQKALYENAKLTRLNLEYQIKNDVIRAVRNYIGAKEAYKISLDQLDAAEHAYELETERYNLGVTSFVELANANRALVQAQTGKAQNEYTLVFQRIFIEYAVGTLKPEDLE